ncbi:helix-turn-helix domain-containing protein [Micromonospora sp. NBC_01655]|uniref:helix-turn-helix domain-containing protein n=1 Tax=Micromonospora sp. NBC_01655 TaxID=2975983 RepID=UPI0022594F53|nr:helix-turn-helix transcriptional regulator [Micromonospora sp. NBC_01655]MCX4474848.1 helix-turn-helix domain-containing protein [Micromonospora sp. NBC_01655]
MQSNSGLLGGRVPVRPMRLLSPPRRRRDREFFRGQEGLPDHGKYRLRMSTSAQVRAAKFGRLVDRALREARERGMTIDEIVKATGVSSATLYRWRSGEWTKDPRASQVRGFCEGLGVSIRVAYQTLGWAEDGEPQPSEPLDLEPDMQEVARRLRDPNVSEAEKQEIRTMIRYLARRRREREAD